MIPVTLYLLISSLARTSCYTGVWLNLNYNPCKIKFSSSSSLSSYQEAMNAYLQGHCWFAFWSRNCLWWSSLAYPARLSDWPPACSSFQRLSPACSPTGSRATSWPWWVARTTVLPSVCSTAAGTDWRKMTLRWARPCCWYSWPWGELDHDVGTVDYGVS